MDKRTKASTTKKPLPTRASSRHLFNTEQVAGVSGTQQQDLEDILEIHSELESDSMEVDEAANLQENSNPPITGGSRLSRTPPGGRFAPPLEVNVQVTNPQQTIPPVDSDSSDEDENPPDARRMYLLGMKRMQTGLVNSQGQPMSAASVQTKLNMLEKLYERILNQVEKLGESNRLTPLERLENHRIMSKAGEMYEILSEELRGRLEDANIGDPATGPVHHYYRQDEKRNVQKIEKFSADYKKWPNFKSKFEQFVHNERRYDDLEKFLKLDEGIQHDSEAYGVVAGYDRIAENYLPAWQDLCMRYDNLRKLVEELVLRFVDMPKLKDASRASIMILVNAVNHLTKSLPRFNVHVEHWDPILVPLIVRKMDDESVRHWKYERPQREVSTLPPLMHFLERRADSMDGEAQSSSQRQSTMPPQAQATPVAQASTGSQQPTVASKIKRPIRCSLCGSEHQLFKCPTFRKMSIDARKQKVRQFGLCENCLKPRCSPEKCSLRPCRACHVKHNGLLCEAASRPSVANATTGDNN